MRPHGMPLTPRARSRRRLPVGMAATVAGSSRVVATPGPRCRSTSASTASRSEDGCGRVSRTVAAGIGDGQLLPGLGIDLLADGEGRDGQAGCGAMPSSWLLGEAAVLDPE